MTVATLALCTISFFKPHDNVYADESVVETYDEIVEEINNLSENLFDSEKVSDEDTAKLADLNNQLFKLVSNNPNQFKKTITTDEDKESDIENQKILNSVENNNEGAKNKMTRSSGNSYEGGASHWNNYGDIFTCNTNLYEQGSITGHSGIGSYPWGETIESYPSDGVQRRHQYVSRRKQDSTAGMYRPYNTSSGAFGRAYDYAVSKIGEPYNWAFNSSGSGYYCSEFVYFCWKHADNKHIRVYDGENLIRPWELASSPNVFPIDMP